MTKRKAGTAARAGRPSQEQPTGSAASGGGGPSLDKAGAAPLSGEVAVPQTDSTVPGATVPDSTVPGATVPDSTVPGATVPGATVPGTAPAEPRTAHLPGGPLDLVITAGGLVLAVLLAVVLAALEAFLAPLRVSDLGFSGPGEGNVRIPIALVLALVTNPLLGWFAFTTTGRRFAALLPAGAWCVVWILAAGRTTEGDLLITNDNWVGLLTLFTGPLAFAIGIYVTVLRRRVTAPANSKPTALAPQSVDR